MAAADESGIRLHESMPVLRIRPEGDGVVVETPRGLVRAKTAILATNGNSDGMAASAQLRKKIVPLRSAMIATAPLEHNLAKAPDHAALTRYVTTNVGGTEHRACSCRMGAPDDPLAVADAAGRVYGTEGLRICSASLMASIPCANANVPTFMIAEKIADAIWNDLRNDG